MQLTPIALILCACLASSAMATPSPTPPDLPLAFSAQVQVTNNMLPFPVSGTLYYDYNQLSQRLDASLFGQQVTTLDRFDQMIQYQYYSGGCQCVPENNTMPNFVVPPGAQYIGTSSISGQTCQGWFVDLLGLAQITIWTNGDTLVQANFTIDANGMAITTIITFSNVKPGAQPSTLFVVPSQCSTCRRVPPPYVPAGSCPNSPPAGCTCIPSSTLTFCSLVNYPVPAALGSAASQQDSFVQTAYSAAIGLMSSPSASCQANLKAFLCAFYFPQCSTNGMIFVPCSGVCPTCQCSSTPTPCPLPPNNSSVCTMYGSTGYCN